MNKGELEYNGRKITYRTEAPRQYFGKLEFTIPWWLIIAVVAISVWLIYSHFKKPFDTDYESKTATASPISEIEDAANYNAQENGYVSDYSEEYFDSETTQGPTYRKRFDSFLLIVPSINKSVLTDAELESLSNEGYYESETAVQWVINDLFAIYGYHFVTPDVANHYSNCSSWYTDCYYTNSEAMELINANPIAARNLELLTELRN
ncbi:hypothetical protein SAMN04487833_13336 [Sarcina sp. DSM 11001]|uniref:hypothetical protein n=1 Tax=Sarcina sp. DSM 11001 TaxID=1798184 RepID=UPI00088A4A75|nr:hypothetical protein [Sarcina sp. DSM 11001]SDL82741.1 hypothetical protein SAMN04487833_13336 [Sarcina sp. DSM 11001]